MEGLLERIFVNGTATMRLIGPRSWTNPINPSDVNGNGPGTAADALAIINALAPRLLVDNQDNLVDPATVDPSRFKFYDTNRDGRLTASDALFVINRIGREQVSGESEQVVGEPIAPIPLMNFANAIKSQIGASQEDQIADRIDEAIAATWDWR